MLAYNTKYPKNFANGTIDSNDLATDKEKQSQAQETYERSKYELTKV